MYIVAQRMQAQDDQAAQSCDMQKKVKGDPVDRASNESNSSIISDLSVGNLSELTTQTTTIYLGHNNSPGTGDDDDDEDDGDSIKIRHGSAIGFVQDGSSGNRKSTAWLRSRNSRGVGNDNKSTTNKQSNTSSLSTPDPAQQQQQQQTASMVSTNHRSKWGNITRVISQKLLNRTSSSGSLVYSMHGQKTGEICSADLQLRKQTEGFPFSNSLNAYNTFEADNKMTASVLLQAVQDDEDSLRAIHCINAELPRIAKKAFSQWREDKLSEYEDMKVNGDIDVDDARATHIDNVDHEEYDESEKNVSAKHSEPFSVFDYKDCSVGSFVRCFLKEMEATLDRTFPNSHSKHETSLSAARRIDMFSGCVMFVHENQMFAVGIGKDIQATLHTRRGQIFELLPTDEQAMMHWNGPYVKNVRVTNTCIGSHDLRRTIRNKKTFALLTTSAIPKSMTSQEDMCKFVEETLRQGWSCDETSKRLLRKVQKTRRSSHFLPLTGGRNKSLLCKKSAAALVQWEI